MYNSLIIVELMLCQGNNLQGVVEKMAQSLSNIYAVIDNRYII